MEGTTDNRAGLHSHSNNELSATIAGKVEGNTGSAGTAAETGKGNEGNTATEAGADESQDRSGNSEFFKGRTLEHRVSYISGHEIRLKRPIHSVMTDDSVPDRSGNNGGSGSNRNSIGSQTTFVGEFLQAARCPPGTAAHFARNSISSIQSTASTIIPSLGRSSDVTESDMNRSFTSATTRSSGSGHTIMPTASGSNTPGDAVFGSVANRRTAFLGRGGNPSSSKVPGLFDSAHSLDNVNDKSPFLKSAISSFLPASFIRPLQQKMSPRVEAATNFTEAIEGGSIRLSVQSFLALEHAFGDANVDDEGLGDRAHGPTAEDVVYYVQVMANLLDNGVHSNEVALTVNRNLKSQVLVKLNTNGHSLYFRAILHLLHAEIDNPRWTGDDTFFDPRVKLNSCMACLNRLRMNGIQPADEVYMKMIEERAQKIAIDWEIEQNRLHQKVLAHAAVVAKAKKPGRRKIIMARLKRVKGVILGVF